MSTVVHPKHYNSHPSGVECIEVAEHLSFNLGNALKYLWRLHHKGDPKEQIDKAIFYLDREVKRIKERGGKANVDTSRWKTHVEPLLVEVRRNCYLNDDPLGMVVGELLKSANFYDDNISNALKKLTAYRNKFYGAEHASQ